MFDCNTKVIILERVSFKHKCEESYCLYMTDIFYVPASLLSEFRDSKVIIRTFAFQVLLRKKQDMTCGSELYSCSK